VNLEGNDLLKDKVSSLVTHRDVTDLYAGAGNFSIPLAKRDHFVDAVELDPELIAFGRLAAFKNGIADNRLTFIEESCERYVKTHKLKTSVLLDPPRSGADAVAKVLNPNITRQVVYVSCSLPTLCRDVKTLADKGYSLVEMWVVDMFSQTYHVETISLLEAAG
jgi:23S rRNA (uracil1939-C5)-methyltransferase